MARLGGGRCWLCRLSELWRQGCGRTGCRRMRVRTLHSNLRQKAINQTAGDRGTNVSISADNNSVAAWNVDTLNMGKPPNSGSDS